MERLKPSKREEHTSRLKLTEVHNNNLRRQNYDANYKPRLKASPELA